MTRFALGLAMLLALAPLAPSASRAGDWATDVFIGASQLQLTLEVDCPAATFECSLIDGYSDTQLSTLTGAGSLEIDSAGDVLIFLSDSSQDVGSGPEPAYLTMSGTDVSFAEIIFAGVPEVVSPAIFAMSPPLISIPGADLEVPGFHPFSASLDYSSFAQVTGDLEFLLPDLVIPPTATNVTGNLLILGDIDMDEVVEVQVRDLAGTLVVQGPATIAGQAVTITITAVLSANLSGEANEAAQPPPPPPAVPSLTFALRGLVCAILLATGARARGAARRS